MKPEHKLRMIRKAYGFTQTQMAAKLHICQSAYGKLERDQTAMTVQRAKQLAGIFKVDPRVFTTDEDIVLLITEDHKIQVLIKSEIDKPAAVAHTFSNLVLEIKACVKEEVRNILWELKKQPTRKAKLKMIWWLVGHSSISAWQVGEELLPVMGM